jgi:hypothetical protein
MRVDCTFRDWWPEQLCRRNIPPHLLGGLLPRMRQIRNKCCFRQVPLAMRVLHL